MFLTSVSALDYTTLIMNRMHASPTLKFSFRLSLLAAVIGVSVLINARSARQLPYNVNRSFGNGISASGKALIDYCCLIIVMSVELIAPFAFTSERKLVPLTDWPMRPLV